jgi:hypothetical protein
MGGIYSGRRFDEFRCHDIYISSPIKIGSGIQKLLRGTYRQPGDYISLFPFFQNKEIRLKMKVKTSNSSNVITILEMRPSAMVRYKNVEVNKRDFRLQHRVEMTGKKLGSCSGLDRSHSSSF